MFGNKCDVALHWKQKVFLSYFENKNDRSIETWVAPEANIDWKTLEKRSYE